MGPCWIQIKDPVIDNLGVSSVLWPGQGFDFSQISWCKVEATVSDPKDFNPFSDLDDTAPKDMPPLTIASLAVKTVVNNVNNTQEVVCVTARTWVNSRFSKTTMTFYN